MNRLAARHDARMQAGESDHPDAKVQQRPPIRPRTRSLHL
jgi:hypothetical protein